MSVVYQVQRQNAVTNPRAHVDNASWATTERVTEVFSYEYVPVALPNGADAAFYVPAAAGGRVADSAKFDLPAGVTSGDWVWVQFDAYVTGVLEDACALWANLEFYNALGQTQGWGAWCRDVATPSTEFVTYKGLIQVRGVAATQFIVYTKCDEILEGGADLAALFFTNVQVEECYALNAYIPPYADGDSTDWEWSGDAHDSLSREIAVTAVTLPDLVQTEVAVLPDNSYTFPALDRDYGFSVEFGPLTCLVLVTIEEGQGTTDPEGVTAIASGQDLLINWTPDLGWDFVRLEVDDVATTPTATNQYLYEDILDHTTVTIFLSIEERTLTYVAGANGTISGTTPQTVPYGGSGDEVEAIPDVGYAFVSWSDGELEASRLDVDVITSEVLTASFAAVAAEEYTLTYTAGLGGTLTGTTPQTVAAGVSGSQVVAVPDAGYEFTGWSDGKCFTAKRIDYFVGADVTAEAQFTAVVMHALAYAAGAGGTLTGTLTQSVADGESGSTVIAVANAGFVFSVWSDGYTFASRTDRNVEAAISVTAAFVAATEWALAYSAGSGGTITGDAAQTVADGDNGTAVLAVPNAGYAFTSWSDGLLSASRIDLAVHAAISVTASFAAGALSLKYWTTHGGTIVGVAKQSVASGGSGSAVTATPDVSHDFVAWSDGVLTATRQDTGVTANVNVYARFVRKTFALSYAAGVGGTLRGDVDQTVAYGRSGMPVTAVPNTGYHFTAWSDASTAARRTDNNVTGAVTVTAVFEADPVVPPVV